MDTKNEFYNIKTSYNLYCFLTEKIKYGWTDEFGKVREKSLAFFRLLYKTNSFETIFKNKVATCIEYSKLIKEFADNNNLESYIFCSRINDELSNRVYMHCFSIFKEDNRWVYIEMSIPSLRGYNIFNSLGETLNFIMKNLSYPDERKTTCLDYIPDDLTIDELIIFADKIDKKEKKKVLK